MNEFERANQLINDPDSVMNNVRAKRDRIEKLRVEGTLVCTSEQADVMAGEHYLTEEELDQVDLPEEYPMKSKSEQWLGGVYLPKGNGHFLHLFVEGGTLYQVDTETGEKTKFVAPKNERGRVGPS